MVAGSVANMAVEGESDHDPFVCMAISLFIGLILRSEGNVAAVSHDLGTDLDQLLPQSGQRPVLRLLG